MNQLIKEPARLTRYERVMKLMNQAIEDRMTHKMMQAHYLIGRIYDNHFERTTKRANQIKSTR